MREAEIYSVICDQLDGQIMGELIEVARGTLGGVCVEQANCIFVIF